MVSTAAANGAPRPSAIAAASAASPPDSVSSVRSAEIRCGLKASFAFFASDALIAILPPERHSDTRTNLYWPPLLLAPSGERVGECAVPRRAFFKRKNGPAAIIVNERNIEPGPLFEQLQVSLHVGIDGGEPNQEEAVGHFYGKSRKRHAARLLRFLHQYAWDIGDTAAGKIRRQVEHDFDRMTGRQRLIGITAQRPGDGHVAVGNSNIGANLDLRRKTTARRNGFGSPHG